MEEEIRKVYKTLKFYFKQGIEIKLKLFSHNDYQVRGVIEELTRWFRPKVVLKTSENSKMPIYVEDIHPGTIIPGDLVKDPIHRVFERRTIPPKLRMEVFQRDNFCCVYCGRRGENGKGLEVDHEVPVSKGGTNHIDNLKTSCFECNRGKGVKLL